MVWHAVNDANMQAQAPAGDVLHLPFARVQAVTYDASEEAGCAAGCVNNTRAAISQIFRLSQTLGGRRTLQQALRLCDELPPDSAQDVAYWVQVTSAAMPPSQQPMQLESFTSHDRRTWP